MGNLLGYIFILLLLSGSVGLFLLWLDLRKKVRAAQDWPSAPGHIVSSTVVNNSRRNADGYENLWEPQVFYTFNAGGREVSGTRINFGGFEKFPKPQAEGFVGRYPPGSDVTVRYDPADPRNACLEVTNVSPMLLVGAAFGLLAALSLGLLVAAGRL